MRLQIRQGGARTFLHNISEIASELKRSLAFMQASFNEQNVAAHSRPGQSHSNSRRMSLRVDFVVELWLAQYPYHVIRRKLRSYFFIHRYLPRYIAHYGSQHAVKLTNTAFARVILNQKLQNFFRKSQLNLIQSVQLLLLWN